MSNLKESACPNNIIVKSINIKDKKKLKNNLFNIFYK